MSEWQSIETAPKDATWVEVKLANGKQYRAHWAEDLSGDEQPPFRGWFINCGSYNAQIETPTHWRPSPHTTEEG